jgi:hypothetical protein
VIDDAVRVLRALFGHEPREPADGAKSSNEAWYAAMAKANDQIRATAKWVLTSFAAIGAILLGTIQLSSVGKLTGETPSHRVCAAVVGAALALLGVVVAMWFTSNVLFPFLNSFQLADRYPKITSQLFDDKDILGYDYCTLKTKWREAALKADTAAPAERAQAEDEFRKMSERKRMALVHVGTELLRQRFRQARVAIALGSILTAVGLLLFAWGANPPAKETKQAVSLGAAPVQVALHLTPAGIAALATPRKCTVADTPALQIGGTATARELVTTPRSTACRAVRFVLTPDLGAAVAAG